MQPNKYLLERKNNKQIDKLLNKMGRLLDEIVNFGTHVLDICQEKYKFTEQETPIVTTYSQFLSMVDGISILIKKGTGDAIKPLLRSLLEGKFNLEYMIKEEPKKGVLAYQIAYAHSKINEYRLADPSTQQGKEFRRKLGDVALELPAFNTKENIKKLEELLEAPMYKEVNDEWKRVKKENNGRKPNWYSLFGGPKRIEDLANHLGQGAYYEIVYRNMSSFIHAGSTIARLRKTGLDYGINPGIRRLEELPTLLNFTVVFALETYHMMIKKYNPDKEFYYAKWYEENIRRDFFELTQTEIKVEYVSDRELPRA